MTPSRRLVRPALLLLQGESVDRLPDVVEHALRAPAPDGDDLAVLHDRAVFNPRHERGITRHFDPVCAVVGRYPHVVTLIDSYAANYDQFVFETDRSVVESVLHANTRCQIVTYFCPSFAVR